MGQQRGWRFHASLAALTVSLGFAVAVAAVVAGGPLAEGQTTPPTPPSTFQGSVTAPEGDVAGGLTVIAYIGDTVCSEEEPSETLKDTTNGETVTSYRVKVVSAEQKAGCGVEDAEVRFEVGGRRAVQTGMWSQQAQSLDLTLEAATVGTATPTPGPTEPDINGTPEGTATEGPTEPDINGTPEGTATEGPTEPDINGTPEGTATPEATEAPEETATPEATATAPPTEAATAAPTATPVATATPTPAATQAPTPTEAPAPTEAPTEAVPPEPEATQEVGASAGGGTTDDGGDGATVVIIVLAVVAGLAAIGVVVFSWLGRPPQPGGGEPVIGGGPSRSRTSMREWLQSTVRRLRSIVRRT